MTRPGDQRPPHGPERSGEGSGPSEPFSLEVREQLLAVAEKITNVGTFAWDISSDVIHWSSQFYAIMGLDPAEVRPSSKAFFAAIHADDVEWVRSIAKRGVEVGEAEPVDFRLIRPDGTVRHVHMIGHAVPDGAPEPTRFVGAIFDMTERVEAEANLRRAEQGFRRAQQIAKVGTFEWNPITGEAEWSEQLHRMCGVPLDVKGTPELYFSMVHPDDRERIAGAAAAVKPGEPIGPWEYRVVRTDGQIVDVYGEASPIFDHHGNPTGYVGMALDITQRKRFEAQLLQSQKMEALGRLAGGIAHDFNNLLTIIGAHAGSLRRKYEEPSLTEITRAVDRAGQLTHQLLAFGRQAVLEDRALDPAPVVEETVRMMGRVIGEGVELSLSTTASHGPVAVDAAQLEQVLLNLVINARDALEGGGSIRVALEEARVEAAPLDAQPTFPGGDYVVLSVSDDGVGMTESVKSRVFEPFFTTKDPGRGTGLGLAMVYGIVSQHGGGVQVSSVPGKGTTVRAFFPRVEPRVAEEDASSDLDAGRGRGELLLLVDDDASVGRILGSVLEDTGYRVLLAASGKEALSHYEANASEIAAVVTDVVMPEMGGVELVRALRERSPRLPALYLSGYARVSGTDEGDPSVRGSFLKKPCTPDELVSRVSELLASRAHED
jgi:two-component system, cell cycle sensor histidine kinase and response regulator CckA